MYISSGIHIFPILHMTKIIRALLLFAVCTVATFCPAQNSYFEDWFDRVSHTQSEQPHWITPLVTVTPRLEEEFRYDFFREHLPSGHDLLNLGGGKGLELIPFEHVEVIFNTPPYLIHNDPRIHDGFGDTSFLLKYRLLSRNEQHGSSIVTAFLGASIPTGSYKNGSASAVITPTLAAGKGFGRFSVQSTLGVNIPVDHAVAIGHPVLFNTAFQYHVHRFFWPEFEVNSTFYNGGTQDGKKQTFLTPGLVCGRIPLHNRLGLTLGTGMQVAAARYHNYDHNLIFTVRLPF